MHKKILFAVGSLLALALAGCNSPPPDNTLYTMYTWQEHSISFTVCGKLKDTHGCYGDAGMGRFKRPCALLEGKPIISGDNETRDIYVIDGQKSDTSPIELDVFERTDKVDARHYHVEVSEIQKIPLGIAGGSDARCFMAANDSMVYAGTSVSANAVSIDKKYFAVAQIVGTNSSETMTGIAADERGNIVLNFQHSQRVIGTDHGLDMEGRGTLLPNLANTRNAQGPP